MKARLVNWVLFVSATNPGSFAQTVHRHENKIEALAKSEFKGPRDSKDQHADQEDQDQDRELGYHQVRSWHDSPASLAGQPAM